MINFKTFIQPVELIRKDMYINRFVLLVVFYMIVNVFFTHGSLYQKQQHQRSAAELNSLQGQSLYTLFRNGFQGMKDSCTAHTYDLEVKHPGCLPMKIPNKYCGGFCASYFVPIKSGISNDVNTIFEDCRQCQPASYQVVRVVLFCPKSKNGYKLKKVVLVDGCRCHGVKCMLKKK